MCMCVRVCVFVFCVACVVGCKLFVLRVVCGACSRGVVCVACVRVLCVLCVWRVSRVFLCALACVCVCLRVCLCVRVRRLCSHFDIEHRVNCLIYFSLPKGWVCWIRICWRRTVCGLMMQSSITLLRKVTIARNCYYSIFICRTRTYSHTHAHTRTHDISRVRTRAFSHARTHAPHSLHSACFPPSPAQCCV